MAIGDAAAAAGMSVLDGTEDRRDGYVEINRTRDYIAQKTAAVMPVSKGGTGQTTVAAARNAFGLGNTTGALPIANGGTGATSAAAARTALGCAAATHNHAAADITSGTLAKARIPFLSLGTDVGGGTVDGQIGATSDIIALGNLRTSGRLLAPGSRSFTVSSDYASAYLDGSGWLGISPSAERFKQDITPQPYTLEQLQLIQVVAFRLKTAVESNPDASGEVGVIAEQLIDAGLGEFVIFNAAGETQSVAYERLVLVAIGALQDVAGRLAAIEARLAALEGNPA